MGATARNPMKGFDFMLITKEFIEKAGKRSPIVREALVKAGDKNRIVALKDAFISIGCCELTREDAERMGRTVNIKKYCFMSAPISFVMLSPEEFKEFKQITKPVDLEVAHFKNGLIGLLDKERKYV